MTRRRRSLTPGEIALWTHVVASVEPLKRRPGKAPKAAPTSAEPKPAPDVAPPSAPGGKSRPPATSAARPAPRLPLLPPLAPIDRHERRRLARGTRSIDGRIDLHGMRQEEAHGALRDFLHHAQAQGLGIVLVITGKGRESTAPVSRDEERGILRRVVPQWLRLPDLRPLVVGFEEAHQGHGGSGALYVRLRRARRGGHPA